MKAEVFITKTSSFLPNNGVENSEMEEYLGMIGNYPSRARSIILRQNGIKKRYYSIDKKGTVIYSNAELTAKAIGKLFDNQISFSDIDFLSCGTSIPDQLLPSHAVMTHGLLGMKPISVLSPSGVCCAGMHAFQYAYLSVLSGNSNKAISTGSELVSPVLLSKNYQEEFQHLQQIKDNPIIAFEKDFLRWMLSDGAGAFLLENQKRGDLSLKIEWVESISFANELDVCMYAGATIDDRNIFKSWKQATPEEWSNESYFSIKQDTRLLGNNVTEKGVEFLMSIMKKHNIKIDNIDYILPHISSMYFFDKLKKGLSEKGLNIPENKWFLNLPYVGNVGSASIYLMLDELFHSNKLCTNDKILLLVPESSRFSYSFALLTSIRNN